MAGLNLLEEAAAEFVVSRFRADSVLVQNGECRIDVAALKERRGATDRFPSLRQPELFDVSRFLHWRNSLNKRVCI
jgi:hypothetical protein